MQGSAISRVTLLAFTALIVFGAQGAAHAQISPIPAKGLSYPNGVSVDGMGNIYVSDYNGGSPDDPTTFGIPAVIKIDANGHQSSVATSGIDSPYGLATDNSGNLFIADEAHNRVVKINTHGRQTTFANVMEVQSVATDPLGNVFAVGLQFDLTRFDPQGKPTILANIAPTRSITADAQGNIYGEDVQNGALVRWDSQGHKSVLLANVSGLYDLGGVAVDGRGNLYFGTLNSVLKLDPSHNITTVASGLVQPGGVAVDRVGNIYVADPNNSRVLEIGGNASVPPVRIVLASQSGGNYYYDIVGNFPGCQGPCSDILYGQQAVLSGMSGVFDASVLSSSLLNECYTRTALSGTTVAFTETVDPVGCSGVPGNATMHAFQIASTSSIPGTIQYSIQTDVGTFNGTTFGPVGPGNPCYNPTFATVVTGGVFQPTVSQGKISTTFQPACGLTLKEAAALGGYDHFNWVQVITQHDGLADCQAIDILWPNYFPICFFARGLVTQTSRFPITPFFDVPPGGFQYQVDDCTASGPNPCKFPVEDSLPWYWDEKYSVTYQPAQGFNISQAQQAACGTGTAACTVLDFEDMPSCNLLLGLVPCTIRFITTLAGVKSDGSGDALNMGACQTGVSINCLNNTGTGFNWHAFGSSLTIDGRLQNFQPDPDTGVFFDSFKIPGANGFTQAELQLLAQNGIKIRDETGVTVPVTIDIKPGDSPNSINARSAGTIPVAILSTPSFHADVIDRGSLTFGHTGTERSLAFCRLADVNDDGIKDLVCHFYATIAAFRPGDIQGTLRGKTRTGELVFGADSIVVVPNSDR